MNESIAVVNLSRRLKGTDVMAMVDACARQIADDLCPAWLGVEYRPINLYGSLYDLPPTTTDPVFLLDEPGDRGVWGSHFKTITPIARVFVNPILDGGNGVPLFDQEDSQRPTVAGVLSHELLEMHVDPDCDQYAIDALTGDAVDVEIADPTQRNQVLKVAQMPWGAVTVMLSDFVLPAYYSRKASGPWNFDASQPLHGPFTIAPGGYITRNGDPVFGATGGATVYPPGWLRAARPRLRGGRERTRLWTPPG